MCRLGMQIGCLVMVCFMINRSFGKHGNKFVPYCYLVSRRITFSDKVYSSLTELGLNYIYRLPGTLLKVQKS